MNLQNSELGRALCREYYGAYLSHVNRGAWIPTRFHKWLASRVQAFIETPTGNAYDIMLLSVPPQHGKSMTITEALPSWFEGKYPDRRCIIVSYNEDFAGRFGRRNRQKLIEYGSDIFGIELGKATDTEIEIKNHRGAILSRGVMSGITGNPGDLMIIDDPIKSREEADSKTVREKIWGEWEASMRTRLSAGAKVIVIMTRWHEDDLYGRLLTRERNIVRINIPLEAGEADPLGRTPGDALCPEIGKDKAWLSQVKASCGGGNRTWYSLYMGNPVTEGGNIFKKAWLLEFDGDMSDTKFDYMVLSADCAFKDSSKNDYVALGVWGKLGSCCYLLDVIHKHLDFVETIEAIELLMNRWKALKTLLIEDKANGSAVIASLRRHISGVIPVEPDKSKEARAYAVTDYFQAGNIFIPKFAAWKDEYRAEMEAFPNAEHDDLVDMTTQAISHLMKRPEIIPKPEKSELQLHREKTLRRSKRR